MDWMLMPLKRYADFSGRSRRQEYWMFQLLNLLVIMGTLGITLAGFPWGEIADQSNQYGKFAGDAAATSPQPGLLFWVGLTLLSLWILGTLVPNIAVHFRRFHDQDKSGEGGQEYLEYGINRNCAGMCGLWTSERRRKQSFIE